MNPGSIEVRRLATHEEFRACVALQHDTWGHDFADVVPASILKVSQRVGGVTLGAFDGDRLTGFVFGLTGVERGRVVHWSDMLAVRPEARNLGLGRRLKEHQRRLVRELGGWVIYWTYDPLMARNAHLNFNRLGVRLSEYVEDMYGSTDSVLHGRIPTDRLIVAWPTADEEVAERLAESRRVLASLDCSQAPVATAEWIGNVARTSTLPHCLRVAIPVDAEPLVRHAPDEALRWRASVRRAMQWGLEAGYTVSAFVLDDHAECGYYVLTRQTQPTGGPGEP